jgi:hypothetical protein
VVDGGVGSCVALAGPAYGRKGTCLVERVADVTDTSLAPFRMWSASGKVLPSRVCAAGRRGTGGGVMGKAASGARPSQNRIRQISTFSPNVHLVGQFPFLFGMLARPGMAYGACSRRRRRPA